jgi:hypothetical protein
MWTRPPDCTGNGITIGLPKVFDSRSLSLKIEQLNAGLEALRVVSQNVTENLPRLQSKTTTEISVGATLGANTGVDKKTAAGGSSATDGKNTSGGDKATVDSALGKAPELPFGLAAGDALTDQLNLASQIVNLRTLYERSLSDRLLNDKPRLQAVLGFQVSITPPTGCEDCAAITEIAVRVKGKPKEPVSLVALMPQEKTYNSETISNTSQSLEGSLVAKVVTLGLKGRNRAEHLFLHRDSDTVAFERDPSTPPCLFGDGEPPATVFGWEFRPVLGRRSVSAGTRQMLAVIALPEADEVSAKSVTLEVHCRSYWRSYHRKSQTTGARWPRPWRKEPSRRNDSKTVELVVPNTAHIQDSLQPKVNGIQWVNSGGGRTTIIVQGSNFFPGTEVLIGGEVYNEQSANLVLKSDQALEVNTTMFALASSDAVLRGRFGSSIPLALPRSELKFPALDLIDVKTQAKRGAKYVRMRVYVTALGQDGETTDLTVDDFNPYPDAILLIGKEPLPLPYDYSDLDPAKDKESPVHVNPLPKSKYVLIEAWVPLSAYAAGDLMVTFRVPFCDTNWSSSLAIGVSEPAVVRLGEVGSDTVLRIAQALGFTSAVRVELDRSYTDPPDLARDDEGNLRLTVKSDQLAKFSSLVLHHNKYSFVLPIPARQAAPKAMIDINVKPPQIAKGTGGLVEWTGSALDGIASASVAGSAVDVNVYDSGTRLAVFIPAAATAQTGKLELECLTRANEKLKALLFVV